MSEESIQISIEELLTEIRSIDPSIIALAMERIRTRQLQTELNQLKAPTGEQS